MSDVETPGELGMWIAGIVATLVAILGLIMAGRAHDDAFQFAGMLIFLFGVGFNFALITMATGKKRS